MKSDYFFWFEHYGVLIVYHRVIRLDLRVLVGKICLQVELEYLESTVCVDHFYGIYYYKVSVRFNN